MLGCRCHSLVPAWRRRSRSLRLARAILFRGLSDFAPGRGGRTKQLPVFSGRCPACQGRQSGPWASVPNSWRDRGADWAVSRTRRLLPAESTWKCNCQLSERPGKQTLCAGLGLGIRRVYHWLVQYESTLVRYWLWLLVVADKMPYMTFQLGPALGFVRDHWQMEWSSPPRDAST